MKGLKGPLFWGNLGQNILGGRGDLKIFSKTGKALEYFGFEVSAAGSRIPNMRSIELKMVTSETPIMYFSRDAMDDISDASLAVASFNV